MSPRDGLTGLTIAFGLTAGIGPATVTLGFVPAMAGNAQDASWDSTKCPDSQFDPAYSADLPQLPIRQWIIFGPDSSLTAENAEIAERRETPRKRISLRLVYGLKL